MDQLFAFIGTHCGESLEVRAEGSVELLMEWYTFPGEVPRLLTGISRFWRQGIQRRVQPQHRGHVDEAGSGNLLSIFSRFRCPARLLMSVAGKAP